MPWIKIQATLIDDPAVSAIGARLRMAEAHVVGCLVAVWSWADSLTADGFVQHATAAQIDRKAGKKGFADAMTCVGWLRIEPAGVVFPKWDRHNGESAKARAGEAEAKRLSRAGVRRSSPAPVSAPRVPEMSGQVSGQNGDECRDQRREEERRGENTNTTEEPGSADADTIERLNDAPGELALESETDTTAAAKPAPTVFPANLDTPAFRAAWADWIAYRIENKLKAWKPVTITAKLNELAAWGEPAAIASIRQSIANGWQGLFEPKGSHTVKRPATSAGSTYEKEAKAHAYTV